MAGIDYKICDERESFSALIVQMPREQQAMYRSFGHNRSESVFMRRFFCLYQCMGTNENRTSNDPRVIAKVGVTNLAFDLKEGFQVTFGVFDAADKIAQFQTVGGTPQRLFDHDIFVSVPCSFGLRRNHVVHTSGDTSWDISAIVYLKTRNRSEFYRKGDIQLETPAKFRRLYPNFQWST